MESYYYSEEQLEIDVERLIHGKFDGYIVSTMRNLIGCGFILGGFEKLTNYEEMARIVNPSDDSTITRNERPVAEKTVFKPGHISNETIRESLETAIKASGEQYAEKLLVCQLMTSHDKATTESLRTQTLYPVGSLSLVRIHPLTDYLNIIDVE